MRKNTAHSILHRRQHLQFLLEQRRENRQKPSCEQFSAARKRLWQISALVNPTKTLNRDVAPSGDDIEAVVESRADVEMGNDEDEDPLASEVPRARMNQSKESNKQRETGT